MNTPRGVWLDDLTWQEATSRFAEDAVVVMPVVFGESLKNMPHLPLKASAVIARALAQSLVERLSVVVAPVLDRSLFPRSDAAGQILSERVAQFRSLGVRRLVILDASVSLYPPLGVSLDVPVLTARDRADPVEWATSCMLALDPRSVRMPLLPPGSGAQAFAGERAMEMDAGFLMNALVAKWPDIGP